MVGLVQIQRQPGFEGFLGGERVGRWWGVRDAEQLLGVRVWGWDLDFGHFEGVEGEEIEEEGVV